MKKSEKKDECAAETEKTASFWDRLDLACRKKGVTVAKVVAELGIAPGTPTNWKKSAPNGETVLALAQRLGVTTDSLLSDVAVDQTDGAAAAKTDIQYAMDTFNEIDRRHNETIQNLVGAISNAQKEAGIVISVVGTEIKTSIARVADQLALFEGIHSKKPYGRSSDPYNTEVLDTEKPRPKQPYVGPGISVGHR
jgi:transcriptional regulator with XRE-family HTH domain